MGYANLLNRHFEDWIIVEQKKGEIQTNDRAIMFTDHVGTILLVYLLWLHTRPTCSLSGLPVR
jgi:hypothetical protein